MVRPHFRLYVLLGPQQAQPDVLTEPGQCVYPFSTNPPCIWSGPLDQLPVVLAARSFHPAGGVNIVMADGGVHFVKNQVDLSVWRALSTTQGGEIISADSY